jgi:hypothetical protein
MLIDFHSTTRRLPTVTTKRSSHCATATTMTKSLVFVSAVAVAVATTIGGGNVEAFTVGGGFGSRTSCSTTTTTTGICMSSTTANASSDFGSAMPTKVDPHDIIGVEPEKLALGIDPDEFLEWVGTYVFDYLCVWICYVVPCFLLLDPCGQTFLNHSLLVSYFACLLIPYHSTTVVTN